MKQKNIEEIGYINKGTGKHQSNVVYGRGGYSPTLCAALGVKYWIFILEKKKCYGKK
jgi:hypothetical protein